MRILDSCQQRYEGFTLLELLVVLTLLGLLTSLVLPRLATLYSRWQTVYERDHILMNLQALGYTFLQQGTDFQLHQPLNPPAALPPLPFELPDGWLLYTKIPIRFLDNGVCLGGTLYLQHEGHTFPIEMRPPFCQPAS
jgi:general secretion pathway protein G